MDWEFSTFTPLIEEVGPRVVAFQLGYQHGDDLTGVNFCANQLYLVDNTSEQVLCSYWMFKAEKETIHLYSVKVYLFYNDIVINIFLHMKWMVRKRGACKRVSRDL